MGKIKYLSVCSGIEAASVGWHSLGWEPVAFAEIDPFASSILAHHYPEVPNLGDFTKIGVEHVGAIDVLVGGTPCQSFSVAGLRGGLGDERGNLALEFLRLADRLRPRWVVWENVPGVLSSTSHISPDPCPPANDLEGPDGPCDGEEVVVEDEYDSDEDHAFSCFLAGLSELGYGYAYGTLDAQHFGVPQRRRRIFVVGHLGDWRGPAAVLFDWHCLSGHPAPSREKRESATYDVAPCVGASGRGFDRAGDTRGQDCVVPTAFCGNNTGGPIDVATACNAHGGPNGRLDFESETFVTGTLNGNGKAAGSATQQDAETNMLIPIAIQERAICENPAAGPDGVGIREDGLAYTLEGRAVPQAVAFSCKDSGLDSGEISPTLRGMGHSESHANAGGQVAVAFNLRGREGGAMAEMAEMASLRASSGGSSRTYIGQMRVRRLTPKECERLQGFKDNWTKINSKTADGPRYRVIGNSMATVVMKWLGERIDMVDKLP